MPVPKRARSSERDDSCPDGHVRLHLHQIPSDDTTGADPLRDAYLEIPIKTIKTLCLSPLKYLRYLGWSTLGVDGHISTTLQPGTCLPAEVIIKNRKTYYYIVDEEGPLLTMRRQVVDLEVIKARTAVTSSSETWSEAPDQLTDPVRERDLRCVFTGERRPLCAALHLIPRARGDEWLKCIISNRRGMDGGVDIDLDSIDDVRNVLFGSVSIERLLNDRNIAILKTPNHVLDVDDIPHAQDPRLSLTPNTGFPNGIRFTAQYLQLPDDYDTLDSVRHIMPNNSDAMFKTGTPKDDLPAGIIIHYIYGATAFKWWGKHSALLADFVTPRPPAAVPKPMGHPLKKTNRQSSRIKRPGGALEAPSDDQQGEQITGNAESLDPLDVIFFFWSNTPTAINRYRQEEERLKAQISGWAENVAREDCHSSA
ncbi:hypothetical protein HWV62_23436 [Athelia sp. TMB]|nr:hypothetical protein HWV62_23436 [Athelia sp. TMB]